MHDMYVGRRQNRTNIPFVGKDLRMHVLYPILPSYTSRRLLISSIGANYQGFRPTIPDGAGGWGAAGLLSIATIVSQSAGMAVGGALVAHVKSEEEEREAPREMASLDRSDGADTHEASHRSEGLGSRILKEVGEAGADGLSPEVLRKVVGADVEAAVEQMQMDSLLYVKDGRLFLL